MERVVEMTRIKGLGRDCEILGTIAVVISLLFVAHSINLNTTVLQSLNDNLLYDYDNLRIDDFNDIQQDTRKLAAPSR